MKKIVLQYHLWITGLMSLTLASCNTKYRVWVGEGAEQKIFNYAYGDHKQQKMDVFLPQEYSEQSPIVVLVHGGGWKIGKKEHLIHVQKHLHKNNIPTVNIDYRLLKNGMTYHAQLEDIELALDKIDSLLEKAKLQPNNYILLGESSGAHISLLYAYRNPDRIKKVIALSPPTDLYSDNYRKSKYYQLTHRTFQSVVGKKYSDSLNIEAFREASPIYQVSNVPTLHFQGYKDLLVNKKQGIALDSVLTEKGIKHRFLKMKNAGHVPRLYNKKIRDKIIYPALLDWIKD